MNTITKAEKVKRAYYDSAYENYHTEGCYSYAVSVARALGGVEITNSSHYNPAQNHLSQS